jgi:hypothetical protein
MATSKNRVFGGSLISKPFSMIATIHEYKEFYFTKSTRHLGKQGQEIKSGVSCSLRLAPID